MKRKRLYALVLCVVMLAGCLPSSVLATDTVTDTGEKVTEVSTAAEVRAALENNAGAHIRLTKNISFTRASAPDWNCGVYLGKGCYTVDLNGFMLKYHFMTGGEFSDAGTPIHTGQAKRLVLNGPGSLVGGCHGLEHGNQFGSLIVNGGTIKGVMGHGLRFLGGISYINGGDIRGNFGSIDQEGGIIVLNGGKVGRIHSTDRGHKPLSRATIKDGIFNGFAELENIILSVEDLSIAAGSSMKISAGGGLIVAGSFINNGTFDWEAGLKSIGGIAEIKGDLGYERPNRPSSIYTDMDFESLELKEKAGLKIENGATLTVKGAFSSHVNSQIEVANGNLLLLGSVDHKGVAKGIPELGGGRGAHGGPSAVDAAVRLKRLGLFRGVGTNPDGSTDFDLRRAPSRIEILVMLIRLLGKDEEANKGTWQHPFTDVPEWADEEVGYAWEKGLTKGSSSTEFGMGPASAQMYITLVLRALGYSDAPGGDFTWDQPEDLATRARILPDNVCLENFTRADMAIISDVALMAKLKEEHKPLLEKLTAEGAITFSENSELIKALTAPGSGPVTLCKDEVVDVSGLDFTGIKEIILNGFNLTLMGRFNINSKPHWDIFPGDGTSGSLDISKLDFDFDRFSSGLSGELPVIEIHSVKNLCLPREEGRIKLSEDSDLTVISCVIQ